MNYTANVYPFRQDSSFLYFWNVDQPGLAALIDVDVRHRRRCLATTSRSRMSCGRDRSRRSPIGRRKARWRRRRRRRPWPNAWPRRCRRAGRCISSRRIAAEHTVKLAALLGVAPSAVKEKRSTPLHQAVAAQRLYKTPEEVADIELAVDVSREMYAAAMRAAAPGKKEHEIVAEIARVVMARGCTYAFPPICSVHGETLHNPFYRNTLEAGGWMVLDSGVETPSRYASDITRTIPVERDVLVAAARDLRSGASRADRRDRGGRARRAVSRRPPWRGEIIRERSHGPRPDEGQRRRGGRRRRARALLPARPRTHDGPRRPRHGKPRRGHRRLRARRAAELAVRPGYLRLARRLEAGFVITVEPGLYFIPALIDPWKAEGRHTAFINYAEVEKFRDARGCRIEDDVLVTRGGRPRARTGDSEDDCRRRGGLRAVTGRGPGGQVPFQASPGPPGLPDAAFWENTRILGSNLPH